MLGRTGEETWRRDTSPRLGDPTLLGLVGRLGEAGLLEPSTLAAATRELLGDMLSLREYLLGSLGSSLCSVSGEERGGVARLGPPLVPCCGEGGGEGGRAARAGYWDTTGSRDGR